MSRTLNSAKNLATGVGISVVMTLVGFFTRKIFVDTIGVEYLGLNGLLQNILGVMSLLEGGFATSVVYNMYKPLAEDNRQDIIALLQLYKKVYRFIACGVITFGLALYPFLDFFVKGTDNLQYVSVVYFIFLFNSVLQYFTAYKWSLINASQQNYKLAAINLTYQLTLSFAKVGVLYYTRNYILFLTVEALCGLCLNVAIVRKANKLFPYIVNAAKYAVKPEVKRNIITNMKALFLHSLGGFFMHSTDNIIMSAYIGVGIVGLYSNYTLLTTTINSLTTQVLGSFSESVGNLIATEDKGRSYEVFKTIFFVNFLTISIPVIFLAVLSQPFIRWWLGEQYILSNLVLGIILFNFYINGMRNCALTFKTKAGIFLQDRYTPLLQGLINLALSLLFVRWWGLGGVLLATGLSILSIGFWQWPRLIYKHVFSVPLKQYFIRYATYSLTLLVATILSLSASSFIGCRNPLFELAAHMIITTIVISCTYYLAFCKSAEFKQLMAYVKSILKRNVSATRISYANEN